MCYVCTNCGKCGKASDIHTLVKCPQCDKFVIPGSTTCIHCGASLTEENLVTEEIHAAGVEENSKQTTTSEQPMEDTQ